MSRKFQEPHFLEEFDLM